MKRKNWLALLLAFIMLLCLCACGDDSKKEETKTSKTTITTKSDDKNQPNIDDKFNGEDLNINTELPTLKEGILNIALFGLDERGETDETLTANGKSKTYHSDAVMILTIDRRDSSNPKIKLSSIARDTLVYVEGYNSKNSKTKLAHAFQYGYNKARSEDRERRYTQEDYKNAGAKAAVKALNYNFCLNITNYAYMNFVEFAEIIDYIGGVTINVQQRELNEMNKHIRSANVECALEVKELSQAGEQVLNGGQALAYCRIRKIDSDLKRTQRCRDVLVAAYNKVKTVPINKLPNVIAKTLDLCHTNLTKEELLEIGTWAVTNNPEILNYTLPDTTVKADWIWEGTHPDYGWVWIYDLDYASALMIDFIYDEDTAKDMAKPTMPDEPRVTGTTTAATTTTSTTTTTTTATSAISSPSDAPILSSDDPSLGDPTLPTMP